MPSPKRLTPITLRGRNQTIFRYLSRQPKKLGPPSVTWASCKVKDSVKTPFSKERHLPNFGLYLSPAEWQILGLAGLALSAPLSLAYIAPTWVITTTSILTGGGVSGAVPALGLAGSSLTGLLSTIFSPNGPTLANINKPCGSEDERAAF